MSKLLFIGTAGSSDPTQAVMPFVMARGALEAGHEATIFLANEAVYLLKDAVAKEVKGVGWPTAAELFTELVGKGVPIRV